MNPRRVPRLLPRTPDFDPVTEFPEDIGRLVMVATNAGYQLSPQDAAELWRRHAGEVCASWFAVTGNDQDILAALLQHAEVLTDEADRPVPPDGYATWFDYAVDTMDSRSEEIERLFLDKPVLRESMREAVHAEHVALRRKAGDSLASDSEFG